MHTNGTHPALQDYDHHHPRPALLLRRRRCRRRASAAAKYSRPRSDDAAATVGGVLTPSNPPHPTISLSMVQLPLINPEWIHDAWRSWPETSTPPHTHKHPASRLLTTQRVCVPPYTLSVLLLYMVPNTIKSTHRGGYRGRSLSQLQMDEGGVRSGYGEPPRPQSQSMLAVSVAFPKPQQIRAALKLSLWIQFDIL